MFQIGDKIVYPMHGAGVISGIEEREIHGTCMKYFVVSLELGTLSVMIPVSSCDILGVRSIVDEKTAFDVLKKLCSCSPDINDNWNKRYRENMLHLKSGDIYQVAEVSKSLMIRDRDRGLSTGERKMLASAKQIIVSELMLSTKKCKESVEELLNQAVFNSTEKQEGA